MCSISHSWEMGSYCKFSGLGPSWLYRLSTNVLRDTSDHWNQPSRLEGPGRPSVIARMFYNPGSLSCQPVPAVRPGGGCAEKRTQHPIHCLPPYLLPLQSVLAPKSKTPRMETAIGESDSSRKAPAAAVALHSCTDHQVHIFHNQRSLSS